MDPADTSRQRLDSGSWFWWLVALALIGGFVWAFFGAASGHFREVVGPDTSPVKGGEPEAQISSEESLAFSRRPGPSTPSARRLGITLNGS